MFHARLMSGVLFLIVLAADQGTKFWAIENISPFSHIEITTFANLVLVLNSGVTFGLFQQDSSAGIWILVALSVCIVLYLQWLWWKSVDIREIHLLMVVCAGAFGNIIDRIRLGAVIDFLDFHAAGYHWPAFNIADCAIVVGIGFYILLQLVSKQE